MDLRSQYAESTLGAEYNSDYKYHVEQASGRRLPGLDTGNRACCSPRSCGGLSSFICCRSLPCSATTPAL